MILPETAAQKLLVVARARRSASAPATRGATARDGELRELRARLRPRRQGHRARRGDAGPPHRRRDRPLRPRAARSRRSGSSASRRSGRSRSRSTTIDPHDGLAAAHRQEVPRVRRLVHLPDGRGHGHDRPRRRARLPRRGALGARPAAGAEDAPEDPQDPRGRRAGASGARRRSRAAASTRCRASCTRPGCCSAATASGMVNMPRLKGVHYAIESGRLAAEAAFRALQRGETPASALSSYDDAVRDSFIWKDLHEVRNMRQVFGRGFFVGGALASAMTMSKGRVELGKMQAEPDADAVADRRPTATASYPAPDGKLTFDKLSSVFASGNKTRDDQPNHIRIERRVPRGRRADVGAHVPGAGLRGRRARTTTAPSRSRSRRRTASSAARSPPRAAGSRRPRAAPGPSTRSPDLPRIYFVAPLQRRQYVHAQAAFRPPRRRPRGAQRRALARCRLVSRSGGPSSTSCSARRWSGLRSSRGPEPSGTSTAA